MNKFSIIQKLRNKIKIDLNTNIFLGSNLKMVGCNIYIKGTGNTLHIDNDSILRNVKIEIIGNNNIIKVGANNMIGDGSYLSAKEKNIKLEIGNNCGFSRNIKVMTSDGHPIFQNNIRINNAKNISIGDNVWISDNVTILKGVSIGDNSVIGINSTVTKDVAINSIAAGNPARTIKENISWHP